MSEERQRRQLLADFLFGAGLLALSAFGMREGAPELPPQSPEPSQTPEVKTQPTPKPSPKESPTHCLPGYVSSDHIPLKTY